MARGALRFVGRQILDVRANDAAPPGAVLAVDRLCQEASEKTEPLSCPLMHFNVTRIWVSLSQSNDLQPCSMTLTNPAGRVGGVFFEVERKS